MRSHSWIQTAASIVRDYNGSIPLAAWLKQFFKVHKKAGSTDRRQISHLCFCFFRLGAAFTGLETEEKFLTANFLCSDGPNKVLEELRPQWNEQVHLSPDEKLAMLSAEKEAGKIFPFASSLSNTIDEGLFHKSFLVQPDLFLRIRPGKKEKVLQKLTAARIEFSIKNEDCIALGNQTKIEEVLKIDEEVVVQDISSQHVLNPLDVLIDRNIPVITWDCCAASGGKSILLHDRFPHATLNVSDVRPGILQNLQSRFKRAGIRNYHHFVSDVASPGFRLHEKFDLVICDAPCSGSGTWSRTPEQLTYFKQEKIDYYADLQKKIALNAGRQLREQGILLYITCSVFSKENEEVIAFIEREGSLKLRSAEYFSGYHQKADTLFAAAFTKS
jgi:16S rRNA (cytosine967-C5)-methyltransferase